MWRYKQLTTIEYLGFDTGTAPGEQTPYPVTWASAVPMYQTSFYVFKNTKHDGHPSTLVADGSMSSTSPVGNAGNRRIISEI